MDTDNIISGIFNIIEDIDEWDSKIKRVLKLLKDVTGATHVYLMYLNKSILINLTHRKMRYSIDMLDDYWLYTINRRKPYKRKNAMLPNTGSMSIITLPVLSKCPAMICITDTTLSLKEFNKFGQILRLVGVIFTKHREHNHITSSTKNNIIANISHELRTPLNSIMGYTSILEHGNLDDDQYESILQIKHAGNNLLRLINDIIDISKIESNKMKFKYTVVDLYNLIDESYISAKTDKSPSVTFTYNIADDVPNSIIIDTVRLKQILINLLNNSFKFTDVGTVTLNISISPGNPYSFSESSDSAGSPRADIDVNHIGKTNWITFEIIDTGIGIRTEDICKLFKTFSQLDAKKQKGTGLGLSISYEIVQLFGGMLEVDSVWQSGSNFHFTIPICEYEELVDYSTPHQSHISHISNAVNLCILIIGDNKPSVVQLKHTFNKYNIKFHHCVNGTWALETYINNNNFTCNLCIIDNALEDTNWKKLAKIANIHISNVHVAILNTSRSSSTSRYADYIINVPYVESKLLEYVYSTYAPINENARSFDNYDMQILIVEDNHANSKMLKAMLQQLGYKNIDTAYSGQEAIDAVIANKHMRLSKNAKGKYCTKSIYDIILMDILMPVLDGYQASKKLKRIFANVRYLPKIIAVTANVMYGDKKKYLQVMDGYISKPINRDVLIDVMNSIM